MDPKFQIHPFFSSDNFSKSLNINRGKYLSFVRKDVQLYLSLREDEFKKQVFKNSQLVKFLKNFLKISSRPYDVRVLSEELDFNTNNERELYSSIFMLFYRIIVDFTPEEMGFAINLSDILNFNNIYFFSNPKPTLLVTQSFFLKNPKYLSPTTLSSVLTPVISSLSESPSLDIDTIYDFSFTLLSLIRTVPYSCLLLSTPTIFSTLSKISTKLGRIHETTKDPFKITTSQTNLLYFCFHCLHNMNFSLCNDENYFNYDLMQNVVRSEFDFGESEKMIDLMKQKFTKLEIAKISVTILETLLNMNNTKKESENEEIEGEGEGEGEELNEIENVKKEKEKSESLSESSEQQNVDFIVLMDRKYNLYNSLLHPLSSTLERMKNQKNISTSNNTPVTPVTPTVEELKFHVSQLTSLKDRIYNIHQILIVLSTSSNKLIEWMRVVVNNRNPFIYPLDASSYSTFHIGKNHSQNILSFEQRRKVASDMLLYDDEYDDSFDSINDPIKTPCEGDAGEDDPFKMFFDKHDQADSVGKKDYSFEANICVQDNSNSKNQEIQQVKNENEKNQNYHNHRGRGRGRGMGRGGFHNNRGRGRGNFRGRGQGRGRGGRGQNRGRGRGRGGNRGRGRARAGVGSRRRGNANYIKRKKKHDRKNKRDKKTGFN